MPEEKACTKCGVLKPASEYYWRRKGRYLRAECKVCTLANHTEYRAREGITERRRSWDRKYMYGLTSEAYEELVQRSGGRCAICGVEGWPGRNPGISTVDHDHATGQVRGLLCGNCNIGLGMFNDVPARLQAAVVYLERKAE